MTLKQVYYSKYQKAQGVFEDVMIHWILKFTLIAQNQYGLTHIKWDICTQWGRSSWQKDVIKLYDPWIWNFRRNVFLVGPADAHAPESCGENNNFFMEDFTVDP